MKIMFIFIFKTVPDLIPEKGKNRITDKSAVINWKIDESSCLKMNGIFAKFVLSLTVNI